MSAATDAAGLEGFALAAVGDRGSRGGTFAAGKDKSMSTYVTGESLCLECEGLEIYAHRSKVDGRLVVCIDTADLQDTDNHSTGVPNIRVMVNDSVSGIDADGGWVEVKP